MSPNHTRLLVLHTRYRLAFLSFAFDVTGVNDYVKSVTWIRHRPHWRTACINAILNSNSLQ